MRVLHLTNSLASADGGPAMICRELAARQAVRGHDVTVVSPRGASDGRPGDEPLHIHRVDLRYARRWRGSLAPGLFRRVPRTVDVVHLHGVFGTAAQVARQLAHRGKPVVVRPCGMLEAESLALGQAGLKRAHLAVCERPLLEEAAAVHVTTEQERARLADDRWRLGARVIALGVETPAHPPRRDDVDPAHVLFYSRLHEKKRPEWVLELLSRAPGLRATFAGDGPAREALERETEARGLTGRVRFAGHVDKRERDRLMASAAIMALPSRTENFAAVVVEAWGRGLPVLMTPGVALATVAPDTGLGPTPDDEDAFCNLALGLLDDPAALNDLGPRCHEVARRYSWERCLRAVDALYEEIQP
jgi:glycosyltransferase involved in cell wall biosynthesis